MMEHKQFQFLDGMVHYWAEGAASAPLLIFTHGATASHTMFCEQVDFFSRDYRVVVWDMPAHGLSHPFSGFSLAVCADALLKIIDLELNSGKAHLVGQSAGGMVSQLLALDHPENVCSLTMVGSTPTGGKLISRLDRALLKFTPPILKIYPESFLKETIVKSVASTEKGCTDMRAALAGFTKAQIAEVMDGVYQGLLEIDVKLEFQCPLLITFGEFDRTGKVADYSRQWAKQTNSPLAVIPAASHNANLDNPQEFNRVLSEFLRSIV